MEMSKGKKHFIAQIHYTGPTGYHRSYECLLNVVVVYGGLQLCDEIRFFSSMLD